MNEKADKILEKIEDSDKMFDEQTNKLHEQLKDMKQDMKQEYKYNPEQKKTYYAKNKDKILKRMANKRAKERQEKLDKGEFIWKYKTPDAYLEKQALGEIIKNAPEFREYIRQLLKEYEENKKKKI